MYALKVFFSFAGVSLGVFVDGPFAGSGNGHSVSMGKNDPKRIRDQTLPMGFAHGVICPVQRNTLCGLHRGDRYSEVCN